MPGNAGSTGYTGASGVPGATGQPGRTGSTGNDATLQIAIAQRSLNIVINLHTHTKVTYHDLIAIVARMRIAEDEIHRDDSVWLPPLFGPVLCGRF